MAARDLPYARSLKKKKLSECDPLKSASRGILTRRTWFRVRPQKDTCSRGGPGAHWPSRSTEGFAGCCSNPGCSTMELNHRHQGYGISDRAKAMYNQGQKVNLRHGQGFRIKDTAKVQCIRLMLPFFMSFNASNF